MTGYARLLLILPFLCGEAHHALAQAPAPGGDPIPATASGDGQYQAFSVPAEQLDAASARLQQALTAAGLTGEVFVDRDQQRVLVRGNTLARQFALQWFDNAAPQQPQAAAGQVAPGSQPLTGRPVIQSHPAPPGQLEEWNRRLRERYAQRPDVRLSTDARTSQILLLADPAVQADAGAVLAQWRAAGPADAPAREPSVAQHTLKHLNAARFEQELQNAWGRRLTAQPSADGSAVSLQVAGFAGAGVRVDRRQGQVSIVGPEPLVRAWEKVVKALDSPRAHVRLAAFRNAAPADLQKATSVLAQAAPVLEDSSGREVLRQRRTAERRWGGDLVAAIFQPEEQGAADPLDPLAPPTTPPAAPGADPLDPLAPPANPPAAAPTAAEDEAALATDAAGTIGPVQIEFVEGLDAIVVRGNKRDVERVLKIIQEIEDLSGETQPAIEIVPLEHVDSTALTELLVDLYDSILSPRQGRVSIRALVKPNAVLLIGRQDTADALRELIAKLDQPVPPSTQLRVFRLKHMSSVDAQTQITTFYEERTVLGARVRAVADYRGNALIVQASPRDMLEIEHLLARIDVEDSAAVKELRVFKLNNALAEDLAPILQDAINGQLIGAGRGQSAQGTTGAQTQGGQQLAQIRSAMLSFLTVDSSGGKLLQSGIVFDVRVTADANSNSLVVTAPAESMPLLQALVQALDQLPDAAAEIKVFTIINGDAGNLATMLQDLFGQQSQGQNAFLQPQAQSASGDGSLVALRFAVDTRTNSIIASGGAGDLAVVEAILVRLDEGDIETRKTTVYRLRNAPAVDVADAINQLLQGQRQVQDLAPDTLSPFEQLEREVIVVPEIVSNSLIVSATPRYFDEIRKVVEQLDARPPMVMIQVLIAEVSLNETEELGVELGVQDSLLFDRGLGVVGFPFNSLLLGNNATPESLATRENLAGQGLSNLGVGRVNTQLQYGGLVLSAGNESINVLVRALQDRGRMQVLSRPQVMTLDNQPAFVQVGARVPRISATSTNTVGTVNSVVLENVGILLGVTPRTSPDGLVVMEINAEKSQLGPIAQGIPIFVDTQGNVIRSPQINITTAQTTVSARSGQTVVFAGLITKSKTTVRRGIPVLSDIPVLGRLFRFDSDQDARTELLIIMTPIIVNNEQEADYVKQVESDRMNWCLADVVEVHGDAGLGGGYSWEAPDLQVIYPDEEPTGGFASPMPYGADGCQPIPGQPMPGHAIPSQMLHGQMLPNRAIPDQMLQGTILPNQGIPDQMLQGTILRSQPLPSKTPPGQPPGYLPQGAGTQGSSSEPIPPPAVAPNAPGSPSTPAPSNPQGSSFDPSQGPAIGPAVGPAIGSPVGAPQSSRSTLPRGGSASTEVYYGPSPAVGPGGVRQVGFQSPSGFPASGGFPATDNYQPQRFPEVR
ncbi:secretin N-terminal domain-containing protein [Lignipirellula cremea]|uniref:Type II secretion system protein D n=1 Tax=Lignipirellula cremea TaxID=2528010 RepID=A0A518DYC0_9BACT|nr:secretin N-terminal domain-containing protein [Lignipirellula cremea]QDU96843.1 Type II secretion system protein D precursor [Lignipirellula cremea]